MTKAIPYLGSSLFAFLLPFIFSSCTNITDDPDIKKLGFVEVNIEGDLRENLKFEGACTDVFAHYLPVDDGYDEYRSLIIQGTDGVKLISLMLYFKGSFPSSPTFTLDPDNVFAPTWGMANYTPNSGNPGLYYSTDPSHTGTVTITNYDRNTQTVTGNFEFNTQGFNNGAELAGVGASFRGTFTNIPITDYSTELPKDHAIIQRVENLAVALATEDLQPRKQISPSKTIRLRQCRSHLREKARPSPQGGPLFIRALRTRVQQVKRPLRG